MGDGYKAKLIAQSRFSKKKTAITISKKKLPSDQLPLNHHKLQVPTNTVTIMNSRVEFLILPISVHTRITEAILHKLPTAPKPSHSVFNFIIISISPLQSSTASPSPFSSITLPPASTSLLLPHPWPTPSTSETPELPGLCVLVLLCLPKIPGNILGSLPSRLRLLSLLIIPVKFGLGKLCMMFVGGCGIGMPCDSRPGVKTMDDVRTGRAEGDALPTVGTSPEEWLGFLRAACAGNTGYIGKAGCGRLLNCCRAWWSIGFDAEGFVIIDADGDPGCVGALEDG